MRPTEAFGHEHEQLLEHIEHIAHAAREMPRLFEEERDDLRTRIVGFLRGTLLPHARAEEDPLPGVGQAGRVLRCGRADGP